MILNKDTNTVYFSEYLSTDKEYTKSCKALTTLLDKHAISYNFLKGTEDIWCRDYMPIQIEKNKFVQFRYEPSYLKEDLDFQSNPAVVCKANGIQPVFSAINLDGGNVVQWADRAIISDRVFSENPQYTDQHKLIDAIEKLLEVEVIVIPHIKEDYTGHADGMVRFLDRNTVLGNDKKVEYAYWGNKTTRILKEKGIDYIDIPFFDHKIKNNRDHAIGCYINYLEVGNLIVLPIFETDGNRDQEAVDQFKSLFPGRSVETINYNEVGYKGGLLNCSTWTILE